jgi:DNA (cytosine-5)-methyltransferase 1
MKKYNYVDLFAGVGGLSLGFDKAGFNNVFAVEYDKVFAENYALNLKNHNMICKDIKEINETEIKKLVNNRKIDIIIGGPPCQGFSIAGNIGRTFLDDPRNHLFKEFVRFVDIIKPKMFLLENVSAMEKHNNGKTLSSIKEEFERIGYKLKYKVLNTKYYNVPQERRRIVIVGMLNNNNFEFPTESQKLITVKEAIGDLPVLESGQSSNVPNHNAMKHSAQMLEKMKYIKDGGNRYDIPIEIRPKSGDARKYIRYNSSKPSICITGDMRKVFHYNQNRALTNRELARLQTFPDDFTFVGNNDKIQQAIGNAVPPNLAYLLALKIKEVLDGKISKD